MMIIFDILLLISAFLVVYGLTVLLMKIVIFIVMFMFPRKNLFNFSNRTFLIINLPLAMLFFVLFIMAVV